MSRHIISVEREVTEKEEKRIKSNLRKINNALIDLVDMGYSMYLSSNSLNVCDGETHTGIGYNGECKVSWLP
jgi:hypothetical protein